MQAATQPHADTANVGCHILSARETGYSAMNRIHGWLACSTLPRDILDTLEETYQPWRDTAHCANVLRKLADHHGFPGLAVMLYNPDGRGPTPAPPPLDARFEPCELMEENQALADLLEHPSAPDNGMRRRTHAIRRWQIRAGGWGQFALFCIAYSLLDVLFQGHLLQTVKHVTQGALLALAIAVVCMVWWSSVRWLLVPRGVVVRRALWRLSMGQRGLHTPKDTVLMLCPTDDKNWHAELWREGRCHRRRVTPMEATALLAAWQSPMEPPTPEDLRGWL